MRRDGRHTSSVFRVGRGTSTAAPNVFADIVNLFAVLITDNAARSGCGEKEVNG